MTVLNNDSFGSKLLVTVQESTRAGANSAERALVSQLGGVVGYAVNQNLAEYIAACINNNAVTVEKTKKASLKNAK